MFKGIWRKFWFSVGPEITYLSWKFCIDCELIKINKGHVKINLSHIGVKNFISTIQSYVMVNCEFLFLLVSIRIT